MSVTCVGVLLSDWAATKPPNPPPTMTTRCAVVPSHMTDASVGADGGAFYERGFQKTAGAHSARAAGPTHQYSGSPTGRASRSGSVSEATVIATCPHANAAAS